MRDLFKSLFLALTAGVLFGFTACVTDAGGKKDDGVTSVSLTASNDKVKVGETITLIATPNAWPATEKYEWSVSSVAVGQINGSSDSTVTTEENTVSLKGIAVGPVTVSVKVDGVKSNTLTVTVEAADPVVITPVLAGVALSGSEAIAATGTSTLTASPTFSTGSATPEYTWEIIQVNGTAASSTPFATLTGNGATATLTGNNTTTSEKTVTVQVTATYNGVSKTASLTVTIAAAQDTVTNELKTLTLVAESASIHRGENSVLTAAATYSGTVSLTYEWAITAVDGTAVSSTEYAALSSNEGRDSRAVTTVNKYNTLTSANKTASNHTVTVTLTATAGIVTKTATATVTLIGDSVTGISVDSDETQISATGTADFTATVNTSHESVEYEVTWAITAVDGTAVSSTEWASIVTNSDGSATLTGSNTDSGSHVITVTATATNSNDSTNTESTTRTINILQDGVSAAYYPIQGTAEAYADTYLELEFDSTPTVNRGASKTVKIYKADGTLVDTIATDGETMYGYGYSGNSGLGSINVQYQLIQVIGNKVHIIPHHNTSTGLTLLENSTSYYVLIDDGLITGSLDGSAFAGITETTGWTFTTAAAPSVSGNTITVGDGGDFITVQGAFSWMMANSKKGDWTIKIEPGTYYERIFYSGSANITMSGQGSAEYGTDVEIQWCNQDGGDPTKVTNTLWNYGSRGRNVFFFHGGDLILENLSIINTATRKSNEYGEYDSTVTSDNANGNNQAEALMFDSTGNCAAYNCNFTSKQDTIYLSPSGGKAWFYGCKIAGDVDFIWGLSDVALFERCNIISAYDANATNTYVLASHLNNSSAPYGKGFVLYNCDITTESGQTTYLARSPWGSSGNIAQVAVIDTAVTGGLASNPWSGNHVGGDDETVLGWKYYNVTSDGSAISSGNAISASQYAAEFAGRNNIINRTYDGSAFSKASSTWDVNALASDMGWNVVTDNSKATLDGEDEITTVTYDFTAQTSYSQWDSITSISAEDDSTNTATVSGLKWHSTNYGANVSAANSTVSFEVTGACTVTVYNSYTVATDVTLAVGGTTVDTKSTNGSDNCTLSYTGTTSGTAVVTIASNGAYISKIVVTYTGTGGGEGEENVTEDSWTLTSRTDAPFSSMTSSAAEIGADATVAGNNSVLNLTLTSAGTDAGTTQNTPKYKYDSSKGLCIKYDALKITGITGNVTLTIQGRNNGGSERNLEVTLSDDTTTVYTTALTSSSDFTYTKDFTGDDTTLYIGASNETFINTITIASSSSDEVSTVTISGNSSVLVGSSITLTATPDVTPADSTYTWTLASGSDYVTLGSSTTNTVTVTGVSAGSATITATVDGVTSSAYTVTAVAAEDLVIADGDTITDSDTTSRSDTLTITKGETPTGYAGVDYSAPSYTTVTVTTAADLVKYAKIGGYFIIVDGMIDMTTRYNGSTMLPDVGGGTTTALDAFVNEKSGGEYSTYLEWQAAYAAACSLTTEDGESDSGNSSLYSMLWTLNNAYKNIIQLKVVSNTAIVGKDADSGIRGAAISISDVSNVVLRNLNLSDSCDPFPHHEVNSSGSSDGYNAQHDCICIQGDSSYIWIDHCTLEDTYTLAHVKTGGTSTEKWQTYDGLLDIKGTGANITVSYCKFKNHDKTSLIGSSDSEGSASTRLVTYHHNYFYNCGQRLPMVRNTTMHLYNNYYDASSPAYSQQYAVGVRNGSIIYAENNYFGSGIYYSFKDSGTASSSGTLYSSGNEDNASKGTSLKNTVGSTLFSAGPAAYTYSADTISAITDGTSGVPQMAGTGAVTIE
ncbi:MAG: hypothetical protein IJJ70_06635 [Treponema sp.]|nr:hypothetical protein [Treponema sp.]MBR0487357.1 hypothetical protein [Treponema sp.]